MCVCELFPYISFAYKLKNNSYQILQFLRFKYYTSLYILKVYAK